MSYKVDFLMLEGKKKLNELELFNFMKIGFLI